MGKLGKKIVRFVSLFVSVYQEQFLPCIARPRSVYLSANEYRTTPSEKTLRKIRSEVRLSKK